MTRTLFALRLAACIAWAAVIVWFGLEKGNRSTP